MAHPPSGRHSTPAFCTFPPLACREAMESMSSHGNSNLDRGSALKVEGRYDEAITELRELLSQDPNSSDGHHQLELSPLDLSVCSMS